MKITHSFILALLMSLSPAFAQETEKPNDEPGPKAIAIDEARNMTNGQITSGVLSNGGIAIGFCSLKVAADIAEYLARFGVAAKRAAQNHDDKELRELVEQFNKDMELADQDRYVAGEDKVCKQAFANVVTLSKVAYERTSSRL